MFVFSVLHEWKITVNARLCLPRLCFMIKIPVSTYLLQCITEHFLSHSHPLSSLTLTT